MSDERNKLFTEQASAASEVDFVKGLITDCDAVLLKLRQRLEQQEGRLAKATSAVNIFMEKKAERDHHKT